MITLSFIRQRFQLLIYLLILALLCSMAQPLQVDKPVKGAAALTPPIPVWQHLSTAWGDLPLPSESTQQTAGLVADLDNNGFNDFVIAARRNPGPSLVWYQRHADSWTRYVVEQEPLRIEAGGATYDIDRDGDLDIIMGGDSRSNQIWWWENPYPNFVEGQSWTRRLIKDSGETKHHDMIIDDFDGDNEVELVFWNQGAGELRLADLPANPRSASLWLTSAIYRYQGEEHEGLAKADINGDGLLDIVGGGRWFEYKRGSYLPHVIDDSQRFSRAAAAQLIPGGRPEVVFVCGDCDGPLKWYAWDGTKWNAHTLLDRDVKHGHTLEIGDVNGDGHFDLFVAEMRPGGSNMDATAWLFLGDGTGTFVTTGVATGFGNHESRLADLDGDGDLDILGKPYDWETPRLDIWLNQTRCSAETTSSLDRWQRHVIDDARPWRALFITAADVDRDGDQDVLTGGWWYVNPGRAGGVWQRQTIGNGLNNLALVEDFNGDGTLDVLGTAGRGSRADAKFLWAQNDGSGNFSIHENIAAGDGDFLQGSTLLAEPTGSGRSVILSWHDEQKALQQLTIPTDPVAQQWPMQVLSDHTQGEEVSAADLDRDGDPDLMLGTQWLRNDGNGRWTPFALAPASVPADAKPDRHRLADLNNDGRLDVVVGFEGAGEPTRLAWYAQPVDATTLWSEHRIADLIGPMSLDLRDMDGDGDTDVIVGEHNLANPADAGLYVYENRDGSGEAWQPHLVYRGDEHHDGAQVVDIDNDGDWDILSIGWGHDDVLLYENRNTLCEADNTPKPTLSPTTAVTTTVTVTPTLPGSATPVPTSTPTVPQDRVTPVATPSGTPDATPIPTSTTVPLTLPTIARQPLDNEVYFGDDVTFGIDVTSAGPVTYQWYRNAEPIHNAQQPTITLNGVTFADDADRFSCAVTNDVGSVHSRAAELRVLDESERPDTYRAFLPHILHLAATY
ncbi:MAG: VCBS repeat-containing protein [Caldilineaceae bacterium]|nr:VCBS repeat-containing protein [Caldilineaceae bacterium]